MEAGAGAPIMVNNEEENELTSVLLQQMPPGFRFHPTDEEVMIYYLLNKVMDTRFAPLAIGEVDLNKSEPWDLPKKAKMGGNEWWFYIKKDRKYATGMRSNRATESGYWKVTGKDKEIYKKSKKGLVGMKKALVFYKGRAPKGERTNWVIHEYRLGGIFSNHNFSTTSLKEEWVVCRVFHKRSVGRPPLTDSSFPIERPNYSAEDHDDELKANISPSKLLLNNNQLQLLQHEQSKFHAPPLIVSSPNPNFYPHNFQHPHLLSPSVLVNQHQDGINSSTEQNPTNFFMEGADQDTRIHTDIGGHEYEKMCRMEIFSFNNSIISHSCGTGFSDETTTDRTSMHLKEDTDSKKNPSDQEFEGLSFTPSFSDLDSFWSY